MYSKLKEEFGKNHSIYTSWNKKNIYVVNLFKYVIIIKTEKEKCYVTSFSIAGIIGELGKSKVSVKLSRIEKSIKETLRSWGFRVIDLYLSKDK